VPRCWDAVPNPQRAAVFDTFARCALTGAIGEPQQIAVAHLYLMENQFVTGTVLTVDGGLILTGT
jgi:NAD(P)-dependent dehydrogenase (short-subunit alcohol dehydrogenase family)